MRAKISLAKMFERESELSTSTSTSLINLRMEIFYYIIKHLIKRHFIIIIHSIREHQSNEKNLYLYLRCNYYLFSCGIDVMCFNVSCIVFFFLFRISFILFSVFVFSLSRVFSVLIFSHLKNWPFPLLPVQAFSTSTLNENNSSINSLSLNS